jgi:hypothetical protein
MVAAIATQRRGSGWIAWVMLGGALLAFGGALVLQGIGCGNLIDTTRPEPAVAYGLLLIPLNALGFSLLGILINQFRPANRFGWLASFYGLLMLLSFTLGSYGQCAFYGRAALPGSDYLLWLGNLVEPLAFFALTLIPWMFPSGQFLTARWQRAALVVGSLVFVLVGLESIWIGRIRVDVFHRDWIANPLNLDVPQIPLIAALIAATDFITMGFFLVGVISLVLRWRRSSGEARQQMKWLTFHMATTGTLFAAVELIGQLFYPSIFDGWFYLFVLLPFWLGLPVVLGLAIFKYRLYDIDIIIRKSLVYTALTLSLGAVYLLSVVTLQAIFVQLTGQTSTLAVVASTLGIAALFGPLRTRVQAFIDRRFFRKKYDTQQVLAQFAQRAQQEADLDALSADVIATVQETLEPEVVKLWLVRRL